MKNFILILILTEIVFSCNTFKNTGEDQIKLVREFMDLWESGDTLKTAYIFQKGTKYTDMANNQTFSGIQEINHYITHIHNWASDVKMIIRKIDVTENMGYVEWTMTARQTRPIQGRVPIATNKDITINGVTLMDFREDKIARAVDYMDVLGFVIQLGSKVELPGGVVMEE